MRIADENPVTLADRSPSGDDERPTDIVAAAASARPDRRAAMRSGGQADRRNRRRGDDDLAWLRIVLGAADDDDGPTSELLARPSLDAFHLLVPTGPPAAAAAALRRFDNDRSPAQVAAGIVGRAIARIGLLRLVPGQRIALPRFALVDELARALGEPELLASVTVGTRRRNRKPVLQLLTPTGRIVGYAKVGWSPLSSELVANEADALRAVEGRLPAWLRAPVVLHEQPWRGGVVTVSSPMTPEPRLRALLPPVARPERTLPSVARPERTLPSVARPERTLPSVARPERTLPTIVRAIAAADAAGPRPVGELDVFDEWRSAGLHDEIDVSAVRARHADTCVTIGFWHGDLTPWNLAIRGSSATLWDWEFGGRGRPLGFDALHHAFEAWRRTRRGSNRRALAIVVATAAEILAPFVEAPDQRTRGATVDAIVDLYLCELIAREIRLDGQRWQGGAVAGLTTVAAGALADRQARWR